MHPSMKRLVTFDLDSTLADTRQRHHLINPDGVSTDWRAYSMACANDEPVEAVFMLARALQAAGHALWIVSARDEAARDLTTHWLIYNGLEPDGIILDNHEHLGGHDSYKLAMIRDLERYTGLPHMLHVDDYPPVAERLRASGYHCVTVTAPHHLEHRGPKSHLTFV